LLGLGKRKQTNRRDKNDEKSIHILRLVFWFIVIRMGG